MGMRNSGSRVKPLPSMSASTPEAFERMEKDNAAWYAKNGYEFINGGWRKKVTAWNALTSRKEWSGVADNFFRGYGLDANNNILGAKMYGFFDTIAFGSSLAEATPKSVALNTALTFAPYGLIGKVGKFLKLDKLGTRVLSKASGALPAWAHPSLLSDKLREGVLAMAIGGKLAGLGGKAPSILPKIAETSNEQANKLIRSIYQRKNIESDGKMFPTYTLGNQEKKFAFEGYKQDLSSLLKSGIEVVPTTPEGLLKAALKLDPKNRQNKLLLNSFKNNNMTEEKLKFLDDLTASVSINKRGNQTALEQTDGFAMMLSSLTGNKKATSIIDYKTSKLYDIVAQNKTLRQKTLSSERILGKEGPIDISNVPTIHSTSYPIVRDKAGNITLRPLGDYNRGSDKSYPRASLHFTLEDTVKSHLFGQWGTAQKKIVSPLSSMIKDNGLPYQLNSTDTWWMRNPGQPLTISNASVISPYTDSALYAKELIKRGLIKAGQPVPLVASDPGKKEVLQLMKKVYRPEDRIQIVDMAERGGVRASEIIGKEDELLEEITMQLAKKQLGIETPLVKLEAHSLSSKTRQDDINKIQNQLGLSGEIHSSSTPAMLESVFTNQREDALPYTSIYDSLEGIRMKTLHGRFKTNAREDQNKFGITAMATGGLVSKHFAEGGYSVGTDTVPAMLTPGEFVMNKYAVNSYGIDKMKAINNGTHESEKVYNYNLSVNVKSDANPDDIARVVMTQIRQIDSQRIRTQRA
jgi:hypothetical protein